MRLRHAIAPLAAALSIAAIAPVEAAAMEATVRPVVPETLELQAQADLPHADALESKELPRPSRPEGKQEGGPLAPVTHALGQLPLLGKVFRNQP